MTNSLNSNAKLKSITQDIQRNNLNVKRYESGKSDLYSSCYLPGHEDGHSYHKLTLNITGIALDYHTKIVVARFLIFIAILTLKFVLYRHILT